MATAGEGMLRLPLLLVLNLSGEARFVTGLCIRMRTDTELKSALCRLLYLFAMTYCYNAKKSPNNYRIANSEFTKL